MSELMPTHYTMTLYWPDEPSRERIHAVCSAIGKFYGDAITSINGVDLPEPMTLFGVSIHSQDCPASACPECAGSGLVEPYGAEAGA